MTAGWPPPLSRRAELTLAGILVGLALLLRVAAPWYAPRGWRDDELSSALVVTGHVLEGDFRIYYPDASGHEGLYEYAQAASLLILGRNVWGIRGASILSGTLAVLLTYLLTRRLAGWPAAAVAAALLAVSFWSLMYSRTGQRHISVTVTTLLCLIAVVRAVQRTEQGSRAYGDFALAGVCMGIGFYTYFASRGLPLVILGWAIYLAVWRSSLWRLAWKGLALALMIAVALGLPLAITLRQQPQAETRVAEVAVPIREAAAGDYSTLGRYMLTTLGMFTHDGDEEWLYNIPHRPVFGIVGGVLFWAGVLLAARQSLSSRPEPFSALILLWLIAGVSPGILSVPAASLGHTILAQPPAMILPALALSQAGRWLCSRTGNVRQAYSTVLTGGLLLLGTETIRGIRDYWLVWPHDPLNRVLHHSDLHDAARWLQQNPRGADLAIGSYLVERWDQQALALDLPGGSWRVRAFDPRSAYLRIAGGGTAILPEYLATGWGASQLGLPIRADGPYTVRQIEEPDAEQKSGTLARFENNLTLVSYRTAVGSGELAVVLTWRVDGMLELPPFPLLSKPPAPGEDDRPRLAIFVQLIDSQGQRAAGADGLGVDPYTLYPGDVFVQQLVIPLQGLPAGQYDLVVGLYNPASSERHRLADSALDSALLEQFIWP